NEHAPIETLEVDNHQVREGQIARIAAVREARDETPCQAALEALTQAARKAPSPSGERANLLALAIEAARADATLGEISMALEVAFGRYGTQPTPVRGVYSRSYEGDARYAQVIAGVEAVTRRLG